jgi:preprotein translocase subunit SecY
VFCVTGERTLRARLGITLLLIALYRLGSLIPLPTVRPQVLTYIEVTNYSAIWQSFGGNPLSSVSVFALGVIPYVTASIVTGLLAGVIPALGRLRETSEGQARQRRLNRIVATAIAVVQAIVTVVVFGRTRPMIGRTIDEGLGAAVVTVVVMTAGFLVITLLADLITRYGVGSGVSVLLLVTVLSATGTQVRRAAGLVDAAALAWTALAFGTSLLLVVVGLRAYQRLEAHACELQLTGRRKPVELRAHILQGGIAPLVFASSIVGVFGPLLARLAGGRDLLAPGTIVGGVAFSVLVAVFARVNLRMTVDPVSTANDFVNLGYFLTATPPGWRTADRLSRLGNSAAVGIVVLLVPMTFLAGVAASATAGLSLLLPASTVLLLGTVTIEILREFRTGLRAVAAPELVAVRFSDDPWERSAGRRRELA